MGYKLRIQIRSASPKKMSLHFFIKPGAFLQQATARQYFVPIFTNICPSIRKLKTLEGDFYICGMAILECLCDFVPFEP